MAGNPNWKKGGESPNPQGRKKTRYSIRTPKGLLENFIKKNITPARLQRMFDELDSKDQLKFLTEVLPFIIPKQTSATMDINFDQLSDKDLDALYCRVTENLSIGIAPTNSNLFEEAEVIPHNMEALKPLSLISDGKEYDLSKLTDDELKMENSLILITIFRLKVTIVFRSILTTHFRFKLTTPERGLRPVVLAA